MNHDPYAKNRFEQQIYASSENELSDEMRQYLEEVPRARETYERFRDVEAILSLKQKEGPPEAFFQWQTDHLRRNIEALEDRSRWQKQLDAVQDLCGHTSVRFAGTAALVLLLTLGIGIATTNQNESSPQERVKEETDTTEPASLARNSAATPTTRTETVIASNQPNVRYKTYRMSVFAQQKRSTNKLPLRRELRENSDRTGQGIQFVDF